MNRADLVERCAEHLISRNNVALHAPAGMGKSKTASRVMVQLQDQGASLVQVAITTCESGQEAFRAIADAMALELASRTTHQGSLHDSWVSACAYVGHGIDNHVLLMDGLDVVARWKDGEAFLRHLRELLAGGGREEHLRALLISRRTIRMLELEVRGVSTLADICVTYYAQPAQVPDIIADWPVDAIDAPAIAAWSGGIPSLVNYASVVGPDALAEDDEAENQRLEAVSRILDYLATANLVSAAAQLLLGPELEPMPREQAMLRSLGVLPGSGTERGLGDFEPFLDLLVARAREADVWGHFGAAERALRELVDLVLTGAHGMDWPQVMSKRSPAVSVALEQAQRKQAADQQRYGKTPGWLAYTYPRELWDIINAGWENFGVVLLPGDKREWKARIVGLAEVRAPMAHGRAQLLSQTQRLQVRESCDAVINVVERYRDKASLQTDDWDQERTST